MSQSPRYVFFGTPSFAEMVLRGVFEHQLPPSAIVCNPDRPQGRNKIITPPPAKVFVTGKDISIQILQPEKLDEQFESRITALGAEFGVVAAYAKIIPLRILKLFPQGVIGVHPSLLPRHRGASPIQTTILTGDTETGVSLYLMDEKMDHGPVILSRKLEGVNLLTETTSSLSLKLGILAGEILAETIPECTNGKLKPTPQDESLVTLTRKFSTEDGFVKFTSLQKPEEAAHIDRLIRALGEEPGVWTTTPDGRRLKLLKSKMNGEKLEVTRFQFEGKTPQDKVLTV